MKSFNQRELRVLGQLVVEGTARGRVLALLQHRLRNDRMRIPSDMTKDEWVKRVFRIFGVKPRPERNEALGLWSELLAYNKTNAVRHSRPVEDRQA